MGPVVRKVGKSNYTVDDPISFPNTYSLDSQLSGGWRYPSFEQPRSAWQFQNTRHKKFTKMFFDWRSDAYFNSTYTKILTILCRVFYISIVFLNLWSFFLSVTLTSRRRQLLIFNSRWKLKIIHIQLYIKIDISIHTITIIINY